MEKQCNSFISLQNLYIYMHSPKLSPSNRLVTSIVHCADILGGYMYDCTPHKFISSFVFFLLFCYSSFHYFIIVVVVFVQLNAYNVPHNMLYNGIAAKFKYRLCNGETATLPYVSCSFVCYSGTIPGRINKFTKAQNCNTAAAALAAKKRRAMRRTNGPGFYNWTVPNIAPTLSNILLDE